MNAPASSLKTTETRRHWVTPAVLFVSPLLLSAALYLSAVFTVVASLPIIYAFLKRGRMYGLLASVVNGAIVWALLGRMDSAWFFVLSIVMGVTLSETLRMKIKIELSVLATITMMLLATGSLLVSYANRVGVSPVQLVKSVTSEKVDEFVRDAEKYRDTAKTNSEIDAYTSDPQATKDSIVKVLPSVILVLFLVLTVVNLLLVLRFNFGGIREKNEISPDFFKNWKAPDHMVWPALVVGFCLVLEIPGVSRIAFTLFRFFVAIYCIQGLAILRFLFDRWNVKAVLRPMLYLAAVTLFFPLIISFGFFDLWFSFRERFGNA